MDKARDLRVSQMAETLIGSEIIKLAGEINEKIRNGEKIYNLTIGDFNPKIFPIPAELKQEIINAYMNDETNYPPADGILPLRQSVAQFLRSRQGLDFKDDQILIAGGARPLIYAIFQAVVDPEDHVLFPVPSWNNNHYTHLSRGRQIFVETKAENNFMPTADELRPHIGKASLIALCSPLNPTGTTFSREGLEEICDLVIEENSRRGAGEKPLYLMYDQIYWALTFGETKHYDPVSLRPELKEYTIFVDGLSKSLAATGVRVGWSMGPKKVIDKMKSILGHIGAWAPKAEQVASAKYLTRNDLVDAFMTEIKAKVSDRLNGFYAGIMQLKKEGYRVDAIAPQAAIYLTVQLDLKGLKTEKGQTITSTKETTKYILDEAKIALVPFSAFGASEDSAWYRLSVGTASISDIDGVINGLRAALQKLS
jgi:aspartate aminotransferase